MLLRCGCPLRAALLAAGVLLLALAPHGAAAAHSSTEVSAGAGGRRHLLSESDHKWKKEDDIMLYANKVGPFQNPT